MPTVSSILNLITWVLFLLIWVQQAILLKNIKAFFGIHHAKLCFDHGCWQTRGGGGARRGGGGVEQTPRPPSGSTIGHGQYSHIEVVLHVKVGLNWLSYFWKKSVCNPGWKVKGQSWPFVVTSNHCLIILDISSMYYDCLQQKKYPSLIYTHIWPCRKVDQGQPRITCQTYTVEPISTLQHIKTQDRRTFVSGMERMFWPNMDIVAIFAMWPRPQSFLRCLT